MSDGSAVFKDSSDKVVLTAMHLQEAEKRLAFTSKHVTLFTKQRTKANKLNQSDLCDRQYKVKHKWLFVL